MPLTKRFFHIPCKGDECFKLAELIREKAPQVELVEINITDTGLYIEMYGYRTDIRNAWEYIRRLVSSAKASEQYSKKGTRRIKIEYLVEKKKKTFSPVLLSEILKHKGFKADLSDYKDEIITDAPLEVIEELIDNIWDVIEKIKYDVRGTTTKYFLTAASILTDMDPQEVIMKAYSIGLLFKDEDEKYRLGKEWRRAISEFLNKVMTK
ncbi:DUF2067 family protein [Staphylothermus hellenicus]|uniref:DUF2067 domain-containing protein n=1 Tax=Staphylothermus hellenicus (strain DSM 12710 / JCM 10830 / BK20S6-10-b1 / P8) TaxID=591019 RepID=D7DAV3_STAHD|nr:DUF2067 family protein [Staphylothermus hellenicus]ADI31300.1 conserved hypothetical protein [Staphylothermus hellenicus DSM 12710]